MREVWKEVVVVILIGILIGLFSIWQFQISYFLPWKPFSKVLLIAVIAAAPIVGGYIFARRQHLRGKETAHPYLTFAALYWFFLFLLLAFVSGLRQGLQATP